MRGLLGLLGARAPRRVRLWEEFEDQGKRSGGWLGCHTRPYLPLLVPSWLCDSGRVADRSDTLRFSVSMK